MPSRIARACREHGCAELAEPGRDYCAAHAQARSSSTFRTEQDPKRAGRKRLYNLRVWRRFRKAYLVENPLCELCGERLATQVDHVKPWSSAPDPRAAFFAAMQEPGGVQALCHPCHVAKSMGANERG